MTTDYTPMIQQYLQTKAENPGAVLFFRLGDFYEMFFEDAIAMSKELEITLTGREGGTEERIPMCGVPYHAAETYISKLVAKGYRVAICEQVEDPKLAKGIVKREIVRIVTPGTVDYHSLLEEKRNNYLVCLAMSENCFALAVTDVTTGYFACTGFSGPDAMMQLRNELTRLMPSEALRIGSRDQEEVSELCRQLNILLTPFAAEELQQAMSNSALLQQVQAVLPANPEAELEKKVCLALFYYVHATAKIELKDLGKLEFYQLSWQMILDQSTRRSLELIQTMRDNQTQGSLLWVLDKTRTATGGRLLHQWVLQPLTNVAQIENRLAGVQELVENSEMRFRLGEALANVYDLERLMGRIAFGSANGRDLLALQQSLALLPQVQQILSKAASSILQTNHHRLPDLSAVTKRIAAAIVDEPPISLREGGIIRQGYHADVDRYTTAAREGKNWLVSLEKDERDKTGIRTLKVGYNRIFGYYLEVTKAQLGNVPPEYIRKQTLANCERYITEDLKKLEETILGAEEKLVELEYDLFVELRDWIGTYTEEIRKAAQVVATLDCLTSLAEVAVKYRYNKPVINQSGCLRIREGRHPVVERTLKDSPYIPNDLFLDKETQRVMIITGPNMAGKSTYLRMNALIVLMAQMGSYVPAAAAEIGIVDRIFTRVGSGDDLAGGQSTFMVEMMELSQILASATTNSLLVLDEIGRGTSTFDGMSIARAALEYIQNPNQLGARTLFATHYHELTDLEQLYSGVKNYSVAVKGKGEDIVFLHRIVSGAVDKSYGIEVARLAGLPKNVVKRAREILKQMESNDEVRLKQETGQKPAADAAAAMQLPLLSAEENPVLDKLRRADVMSMTPIEAINLINEWQKELKK